MKLIPFELLHPQLLPPLVHVVARDENSYPSHDWTWAMGSGGGEGHEPGAENV